MAPRDSGLPTAPPAKRAGWTVLLLELPAEIADEVAGVLASGALGAALEEGRAGSSRIRVFLRDRQETDQALARAAEALAVFDLDPATCGLRAERVEDGNWVERYRSSLRPIPLGSGFVVVPSGQTVPPGERFEILLDPGRAFGTGEHSTTQLCVAELERLVRPGSRWLDLGCGTGILSIVARRSGAASVLALDLDEDAVAVANEVLRANDLAGQVEVLRGSIEKGGPGWSGVVANIHAPFFLERAAEIAARLEPGGTLIASGFLVRDLPEIAASCGRAGLREVGRNGSAPWAVWVGRKGESA